MIRSVAINRVAKPEFSFGTTVASSPAKRDGKKIGIIETGTHHQEMPHAEFKYESKRFIDEEGEVVTGSEMLATLTGARADVSSACIYRQLISPLAFRNTRLFQRCAVWNRYRFRKVSFEYIPTVASTVGGELSMAVSIDPVENFSWEVANGDAALRRIMGYSNAVTMNSYTHAHCTVHFTPSDDEWYFIGEAEDARLEFEGDFIVQESLQPGNGVTRPANGWQYGLIRVHYEVEFCGSTADIGLAATTSITGTWTVNSNATPAVANQPVIPWANTPGSLQNYIYMPAGLNAGVTVNGVWQVTVLSAPTGMIQWNDAADSAQTLAAGHVFYIKTASDGTWRAFSSVPSIAGDASLDDSLLRWFANPTASLSFTARADLVMLTADAPL